MKRWSGSRQLQPTRSGLGKSPSFSPENEFQSDEKNDKKSVDKFKYAAEKLKELQLLKSENIIDEETYEKLKNKYIKML